jgi:hypothetical protein
MLDAMSATLCAALLGVEGTFLVFGGTFGEFGSVPAASSTETI